MAAPPKEELPVAEQPTPTTSISNSQAEQSSMLHQWRSAAVGEYNRLREHAQTYPYVWASYAAVYGGLGAWMIVRWRKLRKAEDRVRALQERLLELSQAEENASSAANLSSASKKKPGGVVMEKEHK